MTMIIKLNMIESEVYLIDTLSNEALMVNFFIKPPWTNMTFWDIDQEIYNLKLVEPDVYIEKEVIYSFLFSRSNQFYVLFYYLCC